ncbi:MAG: hypothetical protein ACRDH5_04870, partial [bacterium]
TDVGSGSSWCRRSRGLPCNCQPVEARRRPRHMTGHILSALLTAALAAAAQDRPPAPPGTPRYHLHVRVLPDSHSLRVQGSIAIPGDGWSGDTLRLMLASNSRNFRRS